MAWQLQEAKQKFSEVVRRARSEGPQVVTKHGEDVAVILSIEEFERLRGQRPAMSLKEFLLSSPDLGDLEIERDRTPARVIDFDDED